MLKSKYLIGLTGSIACYKTCHLISQIVKLGHDVQIVATASALKFIGEATLEGLSHRPVMSDNFTRGHMMDHISLARWADIFIIAPLTASHLSKFAIAASDDLLSTLYLAYERNKPLFIAPAMNTTMYNHPATQANLQLLRNWGATVIEPSTGLLACGENGVGKMAEPDDILNQVSQKVLAPSTQKRAKRLLITYGGTQEPIDSVRSITNFSTGRTGCQLIEALAKLGHHLSALAGSQALKSTSTPNLAVFMSHQDLSEKLTRELQNNYFDAVIHLAAVSDFSVESIRIADGEFSPAPVNLKLSSAEAITLKLKKTAKIVTRLKSVSKNPKIKVIAFKLTSTLDQAARRQAATQLFESPDIDCVIHNDLNEIHIEKDAHPFLLFQRNSEPIFLKNVSTLAFAIDSVLENKFDNEVTHDSVP